jgi:hypothetical protein
MHGPGFAPDSAFVSSPHGVRVIRAAAAIAGWTAVWRPAGTSAATVLPVRRAGLVQAVAVPPGRGILTWRYDPPWAWPGWWISLASLGVMLAGAAATAIFRKISARNGASTTRESQIPPAGDISPAVPSGRS